MTTRYVFGRLAIAGTVLLLGGCAGLPLGIGGCIGDTAALDDRDFKTYEISYVTDRSSPDADDVKKGLSFGKRRGPVSYGMATVTVPNLASILVGEKSAAGVTEKFDPNKHFTIQRLDTLSASAFLARVRAATVGAKPNDVLVYVHGYLNDFNAALFRAAQIKHDLEFPGLVVAYSLPSQGTAAGYTLDEANVEWSAHNFRKFLKELTARAGQARVH